MPRLKSNLVSVYVLRESRRHGNGRLEMLLLQRPPEHAFPDDWQAVHGHIEPGETAWQAALRELAEETGIDPLRWYRLLRLESFYIPENDSIYMVPGFVAIAPPGADYRLSREHQAAVWRPPAEARDRFSWVTQRDAVDAIIAATQDWPRTGPELTPMDVEALRHVGEERAAPTPPPPRGV